MGDVLKLSSGQQKLIADGLRQGKRIDGRGPCDMRTIYVETDVMDSADGSSRIRLGDTDVVVCTKLEIEPCDKGRPNEGKVRFGFDFEALPARPYRKSVKENIAGEILSMLKRLINSDTVGLRKLCVIRGVSCWSVNVTIQVLNIDGSLLDAVVMGVKCALFTSKVPRLVVTEGENGKREVSVAENAYDGCETVDVSRMPVMVSVYNVTGTELTYVDARPEEELLCAGVVRVAVSRAGDICSVVKCGSGALAQDTVVRMMQTAKLHGDNLHRELVKQLEREHSSRDTLHGKGFVHLHASARADKLIVVDL